MCEPAELVGAALIRALGQVAEAYGGAVTAEPAGGGGALFTLSLPALDETVDEKELASRPTRAGCAVPSQSRKQRVRSWST